MPRILLALPGLWLLLLSSTLAAQDIGNMKVILERGSSQKIRLSFNILALDAADFTTFELGTFGEKTSQEGVNMLAKFMDICIFDGSGSDKKCSSSILKAKYANNSTFDKTPILQQSPDYSATFLDGATSFILDPVTLDYKLAATLDLIASNGNLPFSANTFVSLRLNKGTSTDTFFDGDKQATQAVAVNDLPSELTLVKSKAALTVTWTEDEVVSLEDSSTGFASGVLGFVIPEIAWASSSFPIQSYERINLADEKKYLAACSIALNDATTCTISCTDKSNATPLIGNFYSKATDLEEAGFEVKETNTSSLSFAGLSKNERYAIILQYQPDGIQRSCLIGTPSDAVILTELGGGPEPTIKDPRCFIATAAYGSTLDPHLTSLRWFRDHILLSTSFGRFLVESYYALSPKLADLIKESPNLQFLTRGLLWLPVLLIELGRHHPNSLAIGIGALLICFLLLGRRRTSARTS